jgi:hypothetical protein
MPISRDARWYDHFCGTATGGAQNDSLSHSAFTHSAASKAVRSLWRHDDIFNDILCGACRRWCDLVALPISRDQVTAAFTSWPHGDNGDRRASSSLPGVGLPLIRDRQKPGGTGRGAISSASLCGAAVINVRIRRRPQETPMWQQRTRRSMRCLCVKYNDIPSLWYEPFVVSLSGSH